jgi:hypothetical protein
LPRKKEAVDPRYARKDDFIGQCAICDKELKVTDFLVTVGVLASIWNDEHDPILRFCSVECYQTHLREGDIEGEPEPESSTESSNSSDS